MIIGRSSTASTGVRTLVYVVKCPPDKIARPACLEALIDDLCAANAGRLVMGYQLIVNRTDA